MSAFIPIPKKDNARECPNYNTTAVISYDSKIMLKILMLGCNSTRTVNFQMFKLDLEKAEEPEIKLPTSTGSSKKQEFQKNIYFCFIDYAKAFVWITTNGILKEMRIPDHLTCLLRNLYSGQEATVRTGHGTTDWFHLGKEYVKAVYCHSAYLTYMQSTSCKMLGWMKHKLKSRLPGYIDNLR